MSQTPPTPPDVLPTPPSTASPGTFATLADAFFGALANFRTQLVALATNCYNNAVDAYNNAQSASASAGTATTAASTATTKAAEAATSAQTAVNAPGTSATSATSLAIGAGSKSLTIQTGKALVVGMWVVVADTAAPGTNWMAGPITYYDGVSGSLIFSSVSQGGSGTKTAWTVSLTVPGGVTLGANTFTGPQTMSGAAVNEAHGADIASAATINLTTATGNMVDVTGTTAITAITLADGAERTVRFTGALILTNGASLVLPGGANITTAAGDFAVFRGYAAGVVRCVAYTKANGQPVVAGASGSMIYLSTVSASNSATVDVEGIDGTYDSYIIEATGVTAQTNGVTLLGRMKIGGAYVTTSTYCTHISAPYSGAATYIGHIDNPGSSCQLTSTLSNAASASANLELNISTPASTSLTKHARVHADVDGGGYVQPIHGAIMNTGTGALTGIRFFMSSGNIVAGDFRLYGIKKS